MNNNKTTNITTKSNNVIKTKIKKFDDYVTPKSAYEEILQYIPKNKILWDPFYCQGSSGIFLKELGFEVIHKNEDFFKNNKGDIILSNPPYTIKKEILIKLKEIGKPFMLLMPLDTLSRVYTNKLDLDLQLIIPKKRIQFIKYFEGELKCENRNCFDVAWFCWKIGLDKDIIYCK